MKTRKKFRNLKLKKVLVLGGYGFIGRYVVQHLRDAGHDVWIGSRKVNTREQTISVPFHKLSSGRELARLVGDFDVIINTVGILRERFGETYDEVHHRFVERLAVICAERNIRLVHVSALGLDNPVRSRFLLSKKLGEEAIKRSNADWFIVRPSLIDGEGGYGAKWFRRLARWPVHLAPNNARGILRPIHVLDLAAAISTIALADNRVNDSREYDLREYDLGGADELDIFAYLALLKGRKPRFTCRISSLLVRGASHLCDLLHITPLSFGHYELLKFDNRPTVNRLTELLDGPARSLGERFDAPRNHLWPTAPAL